MKIAVALRYADGRVLEGGLELIEQWKSEGESPFLWLDVLAPEADSIQNVLAGLPCHPLAIEDALRRVHPPKLEQFEDHVFILYKGLSNIGDNLEFTHQQVAFFVGNTFLVTLHVKASYGIDKAFNDANFMAQLRSPLKTALAVMRFSSDHYLRAVLDFEGKLTEMEDAIINEESTEKSAEQAMSQLMRYRSQLVKLRRSFNYHLRIADGLRNTEELSHALPNINDDWHSITDMHDRFERLHSLVNMYYEICSDLLDGYLNMSSHKLNNSMRILTVVTSIFVPLGFLAGLYGMNFEYIPELKMQYGYFYLLGAMASVTTAMLYWFYKKEWL